MRRIVVIPAVFIGCLVVIWVGTVAASQMPSQALLAPTMTAAVQLTQSASSNGSTPEFQNVGDTLRSEPQTCSLPGSYPEKILKWCPLIESAAQNTGLPANLLAAVMLQESGGDALIHSSSGAVGLMQVMPRDGIAAKFMCVNGPCFSARPTIKELEDPAFNVDYGSRMLADLYAKHGSYREALFRYGPMDMGYAYADRVLNIRDNYH